MAPQESVSEKGLVSAPAAPNLYCYVATDDIYLFTIDMAGAVYLNFSQDSRAYRWIDPQVPTSGA